MQDYFVYSVHVGDRICMLLVTMTAQLRVLIYKKQILLVCQKCTQSKM